SNAIVCSRERGEVSVSCERQDGYGRVAITDSGKGLSPAQLATIFQPFGLAGDGDGDEEGTGLALAIAQRLAAAMRGNIEVESRLDVGSTFRIALPLQGAMASKPVNPDAMPFGVDSK
ncbi:ATP-binding protein, partial [Herbaspirillum sp.]|uniref:sensor histidine kinase n=1 Tax=Herbaspirillum sp. TaxID=1890675 RepID=UPI0031E3DAF4